MKIYHSTFQHFPTGLWVGATYKIGWLNLGLVDSLDDILRFTIENKLELSKVEIEELLDSYKEVVEWIQENNGKRFKGIEEAESYLKSMNIDIDFDVI